jgi:hypothetical protein
MIDTNDNGFITFNEIEYLFDGRVRAKKKLFKIVFFNYIDFRMRQLLTIFFKIFWMLLRLN